MGVKLTPIVKTGGQLVTKLNGAFKVSMNTVIQEKRGALDARTMIPSRDGKSITGLTVSKRSIEFPKLGFTGKVSRTLTRGKSLPRVIFGKEYVTKKLVFLGIEVEVDRDMKDAINGSDVIPTDLTNAPVRLILEDDNDLLMNGDKNLGLEGLATVTGRRTYVVPSGASGQTEFASKTPTEISDNIVAAVTEFESDGKFIARTLAFHGDIYYYLDTKRFGANGEGRTVLEDLKSRGYNVQKKRSLKDNAGDPGFAILDNDQENYFMVDVLPAQNTDTYKDKTTDVFIYEEKITEVIAYHPESIMYVEGVI